MKLTARQALQAARLLDNAIQYVHVNNKTNEAAFRILSRALDHVFLYSPTASVAKRMEERL